MSPRIDSKHDQAKPCAFDQFLAALDNPGPAFAMPREVQRQRTKSRHFATASNEFAGNRAPSAMMAPAESPFWIGVVRSMRARQDRIGVACLLVDLTLFIMIAGRLAWAYAAGAL